MRRQDKGDGLIYFTHVALISLLKRWLPGTHQGRVSPKHLQHYLDEFVFRHNRRKWKHVGLLFQRILKQSSESTPAPYKNIVGLASGSNQHELRK